MPSAIATALRKLLEPEPQPPLFTERMGRYGKILREAPDIAASVATGMAGQAAGGWQGLTKLATGQGLDAAVKAVEDTGKQLTYEPREEGGREGLEKIGAAIEPFSEDWKQYIADPAGKVSPVYGAAMAAVPQILPGPKGLKGAAAAAVEDVGAAAKAARKAATAPKGAAGVQAPAEAAAAPVAHSGVSAVDPASEASLQRLRATDAGNEATRAALRAISAADKDGVPIGGGQNGRNAAFEDAREAARATLESGASFEHAETAAHAALRQPNRAAAPSVQAPSHRPVRDAPEAHSTPAVRGRPDAISVAERAMEGVSSSMETELRAQVLRAVRASISQGASFDQALTEGRRVARTPVTMNERAFQQAGLSESSAPIPGSTEALQRERVRAAALRGENTMAGFAAAADAPKFRDEPNWTLEDQLHAAQRAYNASPTPANLAYLRDVGGALQTLDPHRADRYVTAQRNATADAAASETPGAQLHARLQAVGDARRAHAAEATSENAERLHAAEQALQQHRDSRAGQRAAALREEPIIDDAGGTDWVPEAPAESMSAAEQQAHANTMESINQHRDAGTLTPSLLAAYERRLARIRSGTEPPHIIEGINRGDPAGAAIAGPGDNIAARQRELQTLTPTQEAKLALADHSGWLNDRRENGYPTDDAIEARARVLARRVLGSVNEYGPEYTNVAAELRRRMSESRASQAPQSPLRYQKELPGTARRVDPGWEHQKLIPGLEPLTAAEGRVQAARRLGIRLRALRRGDPAMNREAVMAFYEAGRDNPEMFQYGVDPVRTGEVPRHARLEDFADVYNQRTNADIRIRREGGEPDYDSIDVESEPMRHGQGEAMRNRSGDIIEEKKTHDRGDVPVYDEEGNPKKVVIGFDMDEGPKKEKYVARGGEPMRTERDRWGGGGDVKYRAVESEGGEVMRDERGDIKYDSEHDPDAYEQRRQEAYDNAESSDETIKMRAREGGEIDVSNVGNGGEMSVYAGSNTGPYGSLLYQTLLNKASHSGEQIGGGSLTHINALRILSNANSNFARTGVNPRGLTGTASGDLPHMPGRSRAHGEFAEGPEIWRSESDEALKRAQTGGGKPERMAFDPELGFTLDGVPATSEQLKAAFPDMSPRVKTSGVGIKTLMRSAVFDWLRDATPDEAAKVAKSWGKQYGPLFGVGAVALTLQDALREKAAEGEAQ